MSALFQLGDFILHSGGKSNWKVECDALTPADWDALAEIIVERFRFSLVDPIPRGGNALWERLRSRTTSDPNDPVLIVDDVLTTGRSFELMAERWKASQRAIRGAVVFARGECPSWVHPIWTLWGQP